MNKKCPSNLKLAYLIQITKIEKNNYEQAINLINLGNYLPAGAALQSYIFSYHISNEKLIIFDLVLFVPNLSYICINGVEAEQAMPTVYQTPINKVI